MANRCGDRSSDDVAGRRSFERLRVWSISRLISRLLAYRSRWEQLYRSRLLGRDWSGESDLRGVGDGDAE